MPRIAPLIFVSSTTEDLAEYRTAIIQGFPAIDALYRGMEFFGARPDRPKKTIQMELTECDLYVGIIGHRYGATDETGTSYTEFEYQFAKKKGKPRLVFLADPNHSVSPKHMEADPAKILRLSQFKQELSKDHVVKVFTTAEDLVAKILDAIRKWLSENEPAWKGMKQVPLADRENQHIRELYSKDIKVVVSAIRQLKRTDCRSSLEHFYGLLCAVDGSSPIIRAVLDELQYFTDDARVSQILVNLVDDRPELRVQVIENIFHRAIIHKTCADAALDRILLLSADADWEVRFAVAHALQNIGNNRVDRSADCRRRLVKMKTDSIARVSARATESLRGLTNDVV